MPTIVTIHGTNSSGPADGQMWWQNGSHFDQHLRHLVEPRDGELRIEPFIWDGRNSETSRRKAAQDLAARMKRLESAGEHYCAIGHSHGGSVLANALALMVAKRQKSTCLGAWITVGTPFIALRKKMFLYQRLSIYMQATIIGLLFVLVMAWTTGLLIFTEELDPARLKNELTWSDTLPKIGIFSLISLLSSMLALLLLGALYLKDRYKYLLYNGRVSIAVYRSLAPRWVSLCHEDDEAVQGLKAASTARPQIFHRDFAVGPLSLLAIFVLPITYFIVIFSPTLSVEIAELVKSTFHANDDYETIPQQVQETRQKSNAVLGQIRQLEDIILAQDPVRFSQIKQLRSMLNTYQNKLDAYVLANRRRFASGEKSKPQEQRLKENLVIDQIVKLSGRIYNEKSSLVKILASPQQARAIGELTNKSRALSSKRRKLVRTLRFKRRLLDDRGQLLGGGQSYGKNSDLLGHVLVAIPAQYFGELLFPHRSARSWRKGLTSLAWGIVALPIICAVVALALLFLVKLAAYRVSFCISLLLDRLTWHEVRRSLLGNDTIGEIALSARDRPAWFGSERPYLPTKLATEISDYSNEAAADSLAKFRNAISTLAFSDQRGEYEGIVEEYITWRELIHTSYFDVELFQKLVAFSIAQAPGFRAAKVFEADPDYPIVADWYQQLLVNSSRSATI